MRFKFDCANCGTPCDVYRPPAYQGGPPKFCSQACNGAARRGTGKGPRPNHHFYCVTCGRDCHVYRSPSAPIPPRFCSLQCLGDAQKHDANPAYTGGRHVGTNGYVFALAPDHPNADPRGYVYEHRLVMEQIVGRLLTPTEVVHHINRRRDDNRPENLQLIASHSEHMKLHHEEDRHV